MRFIGGVAAGCLIIMLLSSYFNLAMYQYIPKIRSVMNMIGFLYMIYLAVKIMRSRPQGMQMIRQVDLTALRSDSYFNS